LKKFLKAAVYVFHHHPGTTVAMMRYQAGRNRLIETLRVRLLELEEAFELIAWASSADALKDRAISRELLQA